MSKKPVPHQQAHEEKDETFNVNDLTVPTYITHIKPGNTLCANHDTFVVQNGPTTLEVRTPPNFEAKKIPWSNGLLRDIVWCPELNVFALLTQNGLFTFDPRCLTTPAGSVASNDIQLKISAYNKIKPFDDRHSFWRCTFVGTTVFIVYSGKNLPIELARVQMILIA